MGLNNSTLIAPVQWFGGKGNLKGPLLPLIPYSDLYVEPFGGGGSILCARRPSPNEVYNDLNGDLVNLFRVLQEPVSHAKLLFRVQHTLYSLSEYKLARSIIINNAEADNIERAWAFYTCQNQGFAGIGAEGNSWGKVFISNRGMAQTASHWHTRISLFGKWKDRLKNCQIDNKCAIDIIEYWDSPKTVFYLDPPYVLSTRRDGGYEHECTDDFHSRLVQTILKVKGSVTLSGYNQPLYEPLTEAGWERVDILTACYAAGRTRVSGLQGEGTAKAKQARTESIWLNETCQRMLQRTNKLFYQ